MKGKASVAILMDDGPGMVHVGKQMKATEAFSGENKES